MKAGIDSRAGQRTIHLMVAHHGKGSWVREGGAQSRGGCKHIDTQPIINHHQSTAGKGAELGNREINLNQRPAYTELLQRLVFQKLL